MSEIKSSVKVAIQSQQGLGKLKSLRVTEILGRSLDFP